MRVLMLLLICAGAAQAQEVSCPAPGVLPVTVNGPPLAPKGIRVTVNARLCAEETPAPPPPEDVLHGEPAPQGLLRGEGPADLLGNRAKPRVTVTERPPG